MQQFEWSNPWFVSICASIIGFVLGIALTKLQQRRQTGGKSVVKLREEMEQYREEVSDHFAKTSNLFGELNEKYRDVYNHLAAGSQALCEDPMEHSRLEFTDTKAAITDDEHLKSGDDTTKSASGPVPASSPQTTDSDKAASTDGIASSKA